MINITKLLTGAAFAGDKLRYGPAAAKMQTGAAVGCGPVVVWNMTRSCNLHCRHCYIDAGQQRGRELSTAEGQQFIAALAECRVPVLIMSGGEPLLRPDIFTLAAAARALGIRTALSTNGTLLNEENISRLKAAGIGYIGVSLDGLAPVHDTFRQQAGAFAASLAGIRACRAAGLYVGLRFTLSRGNVGELDGIFDLLAAEQLPRACFYHLVYAGRGLIAEDVTHEAARAALDTIIRRTMELACGGSAAEILTVDNHCDGAYVYRYLQGRDKSAAAQALELLRQSGGNRSGIAIAAVDPEGNVHPDQFTQQHCLGNVREKSFGDIWGDAGNALLAALRDRRRYLYGRCAVCRYLDICNGNFRTRAEAAYGDLWAPDPACYLSDEEIGIKGRLA